MERKIALFTISLLIFTILSNAVPPPPSNEEYLQKLEQECIDNGGTSNREFIEETCKPPPFDMICTPAMWTVVCNMPEAAVVKRCGDKTRYYRCSEDKPLYCERGELVPKCSECGCPANLDCVGEDA